MKALSHLLLFSSIVQLSLSGHSSKNDTENTQVQLNSVTTITGCGQIMTETKKTLEGGMI